MAEKNVKSFRLIENNLWFLIIGVIFFAWLANGFWLKLNDWSKWFYVLGVCSLCVFIFSLSDQARKLFSFSKESKHELAKVIWPSKDETIRVTGIIVAAVILVSILLWCIDGILFSFVSMLTRF